MVMATKFVITTATKLNFNLSRQDRLANWKERGRSPGSLLFDFCGRYGLTDTEYNELQMIVDYAVGKERESMQKQIEKGGA